nr:hypothetical protein [Tanacetum cinerariifolium]
MVTSSVSATPEHESGTPTDSITGLDICTIGATERFVISLDSSCHSSTIAFGAEEFNVVTTCQACLNVEVRMRAEYCLREKKRLEYEYEKQAGLLKARDDEVENLKAQLLWKEAKAAEAARLCA